MTNNNNKYIPNKERTYIARHKITGKEFNDYNNSSGVLTSYIMEIDGIKDMPSKFIRNSIYKKTGNYWYEQYFDIVEVPIKRKKGELSEDDITEIIRLYNSKEIPSIHKLGEMFNVGHKKISSILKDNDIKIIKRGGLNVYPINDQEKYKNDSEHVYKAVHKKTGEVLSDFNNISGALTKYIIENDIDVEIPRLESDKKKILLRTGYYWYEKYFDIVKYNKTDLKIKKCPYCECDIDISISNIKYKNHLFKVHNISVNEHINLWPEDISIFKSDIEKLERLDNKDNWVECKICGKKYRIINSFHLNKHNISVKEYKLKYGNNVSKNFLNNVSNRLNQYNVDGITNTYISKPEKEIGNFLSLLNIDFESNRKMLIGKEIDILCHDKKIGIEFNGCKWHTEWFGGKERNYHLNKTIDCNNKGYGLIHIFEDEWVYNKDIVKEKLKHIFGKNDKLPKIGARKTIIKEIDTIESDLFLNKYHLQGSCKSSVTLGAYYNDELISVMSFKRLNNNSFEYDLTRFATNYSYICQGVGSKMLKYFIRNYNPSSIISFADRRWTINKDNNLYTKLGFELVNIGKPDYRYYNEKIDRYARFHKFGFRKQILSKKYGFDLSMTETDMVKVLGYDRIWDCELFKYELKIKKGSY